MRFDPEDYAFVARYAPKKLSGEVSNLSRQAWQRLLFLAIGLVVIVIIWSSNGRVAPSAWFTTTRWAAIAVAASLVLTAIAVVIEKFRWQSQSTAFHAGMLVMLLVASSILLAPLIRLAGVAAGYQKVVRRFAEMLGSFGKIVIQPLLDTLNGVQVGLVVALVVVGAGVLTGLVVLYLWLRTPRSLGFHHRRYLQLAMWLPPGLVILCGAGLTFLAQKVMPQAQDKVGSEGIIPATALLDDWLIWLLMCGMLITVIMLQGAAVRLVAAAILLTRLPQGPALRVDAAGMLLDVGGPEPQRVVWPAIDIIAGRPRQMLPGPELVIGRSGQSLWTMPFMFFDVMPGTIDSAIRASTQDARDLDLAAMDKMI